VELLVSIVTATAGEAIMAHRFIGYEPYKGEMDVTKVH
jgi:predicted membrane GTPase involved in stress response